MENQNKNAPININSTNLYLLSRSPSNLGSENLLISTEEYNMSIGTLNASTIKKSPCNEDITKLTEKKSFESISNPHELKRKDQNDNYVWFGTYNELTLQSNMNKLIRELQDKSLILEIASIHLENYKLIFKEYQGQVKAFLVTSKGSTILLKLYLIKKEQFFAIILRLNPNFTGIFDITKLTENGKGVSIGESANSLIIKIGDFDTIPILSLTLNDYENSEIKNPKPPLTEYLYSIAEGLIESFKAYSPNFILYYLYKCPGINESINLNEYSKLYKQTIDKNEVINSITKEYEEKSILNESLKCNSLLLDKSLLNILNMPDYNEETGKLNWSIQEEEKNKEFKSKLASDISSQNCSLCIQNMWSFTSGNVKISLKKREKNYDPSKIGSQRKEIGTFIEEIGPILKEMNN